MTTSPPSPPHGAGRRRAIPRVWAGCLLLSLVAAGCDEPGNAASGGPSSPLIGPGGAELDPETHIPLDQPIPQEARRRIAEFLKAMVPPRLDATSDIHDEWFHRTKRMREELEAADESVGNAALHAFCGGASDYTITRRALLMIGAHAAPRSAAGLLAELTFNYGYRMDDRAEACLLLADADPEIFLAEAVPYLTRRGRPTKTMPPDEFLMSAWIRSCRNTERSPVEMCVDVATNLAMEPRARYLAVETLAAHADDPLAREALRTCLIESTGDGYLRRKAGQAIGEGFPREDACTLFAEVLAREVDLNMRKVLENLIEHYCR